MSQSDAMGHSRHIERASRTSASPPKPDMLLRRGERRKGPQADSCTAAKGGAVLNCLVRRAARRAAPRGWEGLCESMYSPNFALARQCRLVLTGPFT